MIAPATCPMIVPVLSATVGECRVGAVQPAVPMIAITVMTVANRAPEVPRATALSECSALRPANTAARTLSIVNTRARR